MNENKIQVSLRTKLSMSYVLIAVILVFVISILTNKMFENTFINYIKNQQENQNYNIVNYIEEQLSENHGFGRHSYDYLSSNALNNGKIITLYNNSGDVIYDARASNSRGCHNMMNRVSENMATLYPKIEGEFVEQDYDITIDKDIVGKVSIASYGPFYFDDNETILMKNVNRTFFIVGLIAMILVLVIGFLMTNRMSNSIFKVIDTTDLISQGNHPEEIIEQTTTTEINSLIDSVNKLNFTLEEQKMLRKRLTSDLAHELRTPIAMLQGNLEMIIEGVWSPTNERLESCHEEIVRLGNLVKELGKLDKIEREDIVLEKSDFDISEVVSGLITMVEAQADEKNISISSNLNSTRIYADKEKIAQVVTNILSNAIKYTQPNGKVDVSTEDYEDHVLINVLDTGMGISDEDLPHIFERLYRTEQSRNRSTGGMGIGLAITKAIVDEHNGNIIVSSRMGEGSKFSVKIPKK